MKATPFFLGACILASIAGAVGGATTNTDPIRHAGIGMDMLPERAIALGGENRIQQVALPDHYAIVTPTGRYGVGELANRGLYAQKRFADLDTGYEEAAELSYGSESEPLSDDAVPMVEAAPPNAPLEPLEVSNPAEIGGPKVIDVAAALAAQG
ncbi:MAG: hypothetical protein ACK4NZ_07255 [Tsuneonella sp.]